MSSDSPAIPPYRVRESSRAKHVRLTVSARDGIVVVIPKGADRRFIPRLLQEKRQWLNKTLQRLQMQGNIQKPVLQAAPDNIPLRAIATTYELNYQAREGAKAVHIHEDNHFQLLIKGDTANHVLLQQGLKKWLVRQGYRHLAPWLENTSRQVGLDYRKLTIKGQKTLWGSCSRKRNININYKLLFLPPHLVEYVFLHELTHLVHLNHSAQFWHLLESFLPECRQLDRELRHAGQYVPVWVE